MLSSYLKMNNLNLSYTRINIIYPLVRTLFIDNYVQSINNTII